MVNVCRRGPRDVPVGLYMATNISKLAGPVAASIVCDIILKKNVFWVTVGRGWSPD